MSTEKQHILIVTKWYPNPLDLQLGIFVQNQATLLSSIYNVTVLYVQGIPNCPEPYLVKSVSHHGVKEIKVYFQQRKFLKKIRSFLKYRKAQKIGLKQVTLPIDLVHVHVPIRPAFLAERLLKEKQIPFIVTEHWSGHLNGQYDQKSWAYKFFYKKVLEKASVVTSVSHTLAERIKSITSTEVKVIPNYIIASKDTPSKLDHKRIEIISVSDLNDSTKNILGLLSSFKLALREKSNLYLSIIGDGPDKEIIVDKILREGLAENVSLLGRKTQAEVIAALPKYDFYVCNSNTETFGMTVAEAILAGLPVICTRCGGPEHFVNSKNGVLVGVNQVDELKTALITMSQEFQAYDTIGNKQSITNQFGKKTVLSKWVKLYETILNE